MFACVRGSSTCIGSRLRSAAGGRCGRISLRVPLNVSSLRVTVFVSSRAFFTGGSNPHRTCGRGVLGRKDVSMRGPKTGTMKLVPV